MAPSVRVKRRHAYASIQDDDRQPRDDQTEGTHPAPSEAGAPTTSPGFVTSPGSPDSNLLSPNFPAIRTNAGRVNRVVRSSMSYRSFSSDPDSNLSNTPPPTFGRAGNLPLPPHETIFEGNPADVVVPAPHHHGHGQRVSRVRSALSSSPSRAGPESDSDSEDLDSDDENRIMEGDEHHHDDDVVDHLDVIGPPRHMSCALSAP